MSGTEHLFVGGRAGDSARSWAFTWNNYPGSSELERGADDGLKIVRDYSCFVQNEKTVTAHGIVGIEGKGEGETPHLQGQITFSKMMTFKQVKMLNEHMHWSKTRNLNASRTYCKKEGDFYDIGEPNVSQGTRTDLRQLATTIQERGLHGAYEEMPHMMLKYPGGCKLVANYAQKSVYKPTPRIVWLYGDTGTGKTKFVHDCTVPAELWCSGDSLKWFDGYQGQKVALFDDFRGSQATFSWLLRLLDRYPLTCQIKGGDTQWIPSIIYITSSEPPGACYAGVNDEKIKQLYRRLHRVQKCQLLGDWQTPLANWIESEDYTVTPYNEERKAPSGSVEHFNDYKNC